MIQTQTLAVDQDTRGKLLILSSLIAQHKNDPDKLKELIAEHDAIVRQLSVGVYSPREEVKWV